MIDEDNKKTDDEMEFEHDLMMENGERLQDLAMALCHYDDVIAKQALGIAIGTLAAHFDEEGPCLHEILELAEIQKNHVLEHLAGAHAHHTDNDDNNGGNSN